MKKYFSAIIIICILLTACGNYTPHSGYCKKVQSTGLYTLFLQDDNTVWAWGNCLSMFVDIPFKEPTRLGGDIFDFSMQSERILFIDSDTELWGIGFLGVTVDGRHTEVATEYIKLMDNVKFALASNGPIYAITNDNVLYGQGSNEFGSLGVSDEENGWYDEFQMIMEDVEYVNVSRTGKTTYIVKKDGTLWGAGWNGGGQLPGVESKDGISYSTSPVFITDGVEKVYHFFCGSFYIKNDNTLWTWGINHMGLGSDGNDPPIVVDRIEDIFEYGEDTHVFVAEHVKDIFELEWRSGIALLMEDNSLWYLEEKNRTYSEAEQKWQNQFVHIANDVTSFGSNSFGDYYTTTDGKLYGINGKQDSEYHNLFYLEKMPKNVKQPVIIVQPVQ